jgi:ribosomal protein L30E
VKKIVMLTNCTKETEALYYTAKIPRQNYNGELEELGRKIKKEAIIR